MKGKPEIFHTVVALCEKIGVPYKIIRTDIAHIVFDVRHESSPCSRCANLRHGILHKAAVEYGCNKIALGHHLDDAVETFLMNLIYGSRIKCFSPVTYLSRRNITLIRPLIYASENLIEGAARVNGLPVIKNPCPANGFTMREKTKNLLKRLDLEYPGIKKRIFKALQSSHIDGW